MAKKPADGKPNKSEIDIDAIIQKVVQQALAREKTHASTRVYSDQPILQRGSDWKKGREAKSAGGNRKASSAVGGRSQSQAARSTKQGSTNVSSRTASPRAAATQSRTGTARASRHRGSSSAAAQNNDLFDYYNTLLNREFGNPNSFEAGRDYASTPTPRYVVPSATRHAAPQTPHSSGTHAVFGSLNDLVDPDELEAAGELVAPDPFDDLDIYGDPYGYSPYDAHNPYGSSNAGRYGTHDSYGQYSAGPHTYNSYDPYTSYAVPRYEPKVELPPILQKLRDLETSTGDGAPLHGAQLFVAQATLAADFEDDYADAVAPAYHYLPTYAELSDAELRSYFTWRASWRHGTNATTPALWAVLMAYEFINGIGCAPGPEVVTTLLKLAQDVEKTGQYGSWAGASSDLRRWARDYVVYYDLDPKLIAAPKETAFDHAVMVYRRGERAILVKEGLLKPGKAETQPGAPGDVKPTGGKPGAPGDVEPTGGKPGAADESRPKETSLEAPSNEELWGATKELVTFDVDRSPFLREHTKEAADVWALVFARMVVHCHKRRKVDYVDSLVGDEFAVPATPFVGVPFEEKAKPPEHTVHLSDAEWISYRFGRWKHHYGYSYTSIDPGLSKLVHALDRQMRETWDYPRKLKGKTIPRYQQGFLSKACEEVRNKELEEQRKAEEAEKRKLTFDLAKLNGIRAAAATTREALLVDEEREGYVPSEAGLPLQASAAAQVFTPSQVSAPAQASVPSQGPTPAQASVLTQASVPVQGTATPTEPPSHAGTSREVGYDAPSEASGEADSAQKPMAGQTPTVPRQAEGPTKNEESAKPQGNPLGLTDLEYQAALLMLDDKPVSDLLGPSTPTEEMLVDSINEKLFDELGDSAFEFADGGPVVVEDYVNDIRELLVR